MDNLSLSSAPMETTTIDSVTHESALHISTSSTSLCNLDAPNNSLRRRRRRSYSESRADTPRLASPPPPTTFTSPRWNFKRQRQRTRWLIPADHPLKITWDMFTILLSLFYIYVTHTSIRDRSIRTSNFGLVCDVWFLVDILLNFVTEYRTEEGVVLRQGQAVWARYLTTWFVVDALSLVPWESLYVKPIIEMQNKRRFFKKYFFRTRAVIRVTRVLRGRHFRLFGKVARHTKHAGVGANRLLRLLIKYVPKYLLFYRNMKGVLMVRMLRQVHWMRKMMRNFQSKRLVKKDDSTDSLTMDEWDDDYRLDDDEVKNHQGSVVQIQMDDDLDIELY